LVFQNESILLSVRISNQHLYAIVVVQVALPVMLCCSLTRKPGATQGLDIKMTVKSGRRLRRLGRARQGTKIFCLVIDALDECDVTVFGQRDIPMTTDGFAIAI
jgi:hypothetical protein